MAEQDEETTEQYLAIGTEGASCEPKAKETGREENHKMDSYTLERQKCGACGVSEGELHELGCELERCPCCGDQLIGCEISTVKGVEMSAEIYLNSIRKRVIANPGPDHSERPHQSLETSGYFRNSYNDSDVMWAMGLSWKGTVLPMLDAEGRLSVQGAHELLALIEEHPLTDLWLTEHYLRKIGTGGN